MNPSIHDDPLKDVNERIMINKDAQSLLVDGFKQDNRKRDEDDIVDMNYRPGLLGWLCSCFTARTSVVPIRKQEAIKHETKLELHHMNHFTDSPVRDDRHGEKDAGDEEIREGDTLSNIASPLDEEKFGNLATKLHEKRPQSAASHTSRGFHSAVNDMHNSEKNAKNTDLEDNVHDDGLSTITADEYVRLRLIPILAEYTTTAPALSQNITLLTLITICLSVTSSIFS